MTASLMRTDSAGALPAPVVASARFARRFGASVEGAFATAMRRIRARSVLTMLAIVLVFGAIVFVLWLGAHAVLEGSMTGGDLSMTFGLGSTPLDAIRV